MRQYPHTKKPSSRLGPPPHHDPYLSPKLPSNPLPIQLHHPLWCQYHPHLNYPQPTPSSTKRLQPSPSTAPSSIPPMRPPIRSPPFSMHESTSSAYGDCAQRKSRCYNPARRRSPSIVAASFMRHMTRPSSSTSIIFKAKQAAHCLGLYNYVSGYAGGMSCICPRKAVDQMRS